MGYPDLASCLADLEAHGQLRRIDAPMEPRLELAAIQRRLFRAKAPAVLFSNVRGTPFPVLANLYGTPERTRFLFRDALPRLHAMLRARARPDAVLRRPWDIPAILRGLLHMRPKTVRHAPVLERSCPLGDLPGIVSWPLDGGPFITLPIVHTEDPGNPGPANANLGMYRVQLRGNDYAPNQVGLHYQIHRNIGVHHAKALALGRPLPVHVYVGGPPCLALAAIMPLPEGIGEIGFAGILGGRRVPVARRPGFPLPFLAEADFCLSGRIEPQLLPEGPFGDHVGYYSMTHDFPVLRVDRVLHRRDAVWPFTAVGRPPQEDTVFGEFIHELTAPLVPKVFPGVRQVHAVDCAGVHPLLLAVGEERYLPYEARRRPRELLTMAMHLLGTTQTALAKYLILAAAEDAPGLRADDVEGMLAHVLERTDFSEDLHFVTSTTSDTLDYTGIGLHRGSKLVWAAAGPPRRLLGSEIRDAPRLPEGFSGPWPFLKGIAIVGGPRSRRGRHEEDGDMPSLLRVLETWRERESFPLVAVADDPETVRGSLADFLWTTFTRSDPSMDCHGAFASFRGKHWTCEAPLVVDARSKPFHAPPLEEDPETVRRVEALAAPGAPLHGLY
ncbi:MAG: UbiD family decarboxylase [Desulfovibrio sp.]|jgi:4-hydroxy-3-polyprenylbenzoate decarboxylase|nr:UbiD family decarboxylase [Desulfovibrio sp.]